MKETTLDFLKKLTDDKSRYMFLSRMQMDADAYCHEVCNSYKNENHLLGGTVEHHIECMRYLHDILDPKPEWLTLAEIATISTKMETVKGLRK